MITSRICHQPLNFMKKKELNGLFKYRAIDKYFISSLVNNEIHFSSPSQLNDPFDCQVEIGRSLDNAIKQSSGALFQSLKNLKTNGTNFIEYIQNHVLGQAVCSFSFTNECPLLWSHYADQHRGASIYYEIPPNFIHPDNGRIIGIAHVTYDKNPLTQWFIDNGDKLTHHGKPDESFIDLYKTILTIKDDCWSYEEEVRIIKENKGLLKIDSSYVKQICFGLHTSYDDEKTIRNIINKHQEYSHVKFSRISRSNDDFGIKTIDA